jgi:hypothetical protein
MVNASLGMIETELRRLGAVQLVPIKTLDDPQLQPCDLLVITASYIDPETFTTWLKGIEKRLPVQAGVKIPSIIYADISEAIQRELLRWVVDCNWYFDIVAQDHVSSLPIRVANFLKLHDHLHEINRMNAALQELTMKVDSMEDTLSRNSVDALDDAP